MNTLKFNRKTQYLVSISVVLLVCSVCYVSASFIGYKIVALVLLMAVSVLAMLLDILPVLLAALLSAIIWNFFFIPPVFTFHIDTPEDLLMFFLYFFISLVNAVLTFKIRRAEKKARDKEEKEKTIRLYNTLLNSLSHELRTPISTIIGAVDALKENKERLSENNQRELLNQLDEASIRLNRQVENLLNMSRLETGMLKPRLDWCDTNDLVHSVIQKIPAHNHHIQFLPDDTLPLFKYDRGLMEQVLHNLIHNSVCYTPVNSIISIRVSHQSDKCRIEISDNGNGISDSEAPFVFDKFYRVPHTRAGGSGLGLSIVKGFVEAHKGSVTLERSKEGGAKFTIEIPAESSYLNNLKHE